MTSFARIPPCVAAEERGLAAGGEEAGAEEKQAEEGAVQGGSDC